MLSGSGTGYLSLSTAKASHAVIQRKACSLSAADLSVKARDAYLSIVYRLGLSGHGFATQAAFCMA
jgi:hypothetical protein